MVFEKIYGINKWTNWAEDINSAISDFKEVFSFNPNILVANKHTFSQFDYLVNNMPGEKDNVRREKDGQVFHPERMKLLIWVAFALIL